MSIRTVDSLRDPSMLASFDIEQQIKLIDDAILPLRKAQKKLRKLEDELANINFLIDSNIGSKTDKASLRKTKRQLRDRRIQLWKQLEALPSLTADRQRLVHGLEVLRRRHGIL